MTSMWFIYYFMLFNINKVQTTSFYKSKKNDDEPF